MPTRALLLLALLLLAGCGESPVEGYDAFLQRALKGDRAGAFQRFSADSRREMHELAARGLTNGESAEDHLFSSFSVKPVEHLVEVSRDGSLAVIETVDFDGKKTRVPMRLEDGRWRIHATSEPR